MVTRPTNVEDCPLIEHLACKLPGELEPRIFDVYHEVTIAAGAFLPYQSVNVGNRDAPWHCASFGFLEISGTGRLSMQVYNSRGFGIDEMVIRAGSIAGGQNAAMPCLPSLVWPYNSSIVFDLQNTGAGSGVFGLFFFGYKIFDRGKAPC